MEGGGGETEWEDGRASKKGEAMKAKAPEGSPHDLIAGLWNGQRRVALRTKDVQRVFLYYGGSYLHMKNGAGHHLKSKRVAPGVHDVWLEVTR